MKNLERPPAKKAEIKTAEQIAEEKNPKIPDKANQFLNNRKEQGEKFKILFKEEPIIQENINKLKSSWQKTFKNF